MLTFLAESGIDLPLPARAARNRDRAMDRLRGGQAEEYLEQQGEVRGEFRREHGHLSAARHQCACVCARARSSTHDISEEGSFPKTWGGGGAQPSKSRAGLTGSVPQIARRRVKWCRRDRASPRGDPAFRSKAQANIRATQPSEQWPALPSPFLKATARALCPGIERSQSEVGHTTGAPQCGALPTPAPTRASPHPHTHASAPTTPTSTRIHPHPHPHPHSQNSARHTHPYT